MKKENCTIGGIPAIIWGEPSPRAVLYVHGKKASRESAEELATVAIARGWQVLSFDLPGHGDRRDDPTPCDVWHAVPDLKTVLSAARERWQTLGLFANSIGAYFSLQAYENESFAFCLFQSPILDMEGLIRRMFGWFGVSEEQLWLHGEIETPVETLSWRYFCYAREHKTAVWPTGAHILHGGRDALQSRGDAEAFCRAFGGEVTEIPCCDHPFLEEGDRAVVLTWIAAHLPEASSLKNS